MLVYEYTVYGIGTFALLFAVLYLVFICFQLRSARFRELTTCCFPTVTPDINIPKLTCTGQQTNTDSDHINIELHSPSHNSSFSRPEDQSTSGSRHGAIIGAQNENDNDHLASLDSDQSRALYARVLKNQEISTGINSYEVSSEENTMI